MAQYKVKGTLVIGEKVYETGDVVELDEKTAKQWAWNLVLADVQGPPADKSVKKESVKTK